MKKWILISTILLSVNLSSVNAQIESNHYSAFQVGESLSYQVKYGLFNAAYAKLRVLESTVDFQQKDTYHIVAEGGTSGILDAMYTVRDNYDTYIDKKSFLPYFYKENIRENKYTRSDQAVFSQESKTVKSNKGILKTPTNQTFDLISAFYFARNLNLSKLSLNEKFTFNYFLEGNIKQLEIIYVGKEVIKTKLGKFRCLKFAPVVAPGRIFKKNSKMFLWVTDDQNRIPVAAVVEIIVGTVKLELKSATGLKHPLKPL